MSNNPIVLKSNRLSDECIGTVRLTPEAEKVVRRLRAKTALPIRQIVSEIIVQAENLAISNVAPGQVVKFHGEPCIVLEHRTAGTLLVTAAQIKSSFGSTNNFAASSFREHLNGAFADALTEGHADELITREVDLTALNGSKEYGSCECKVAPLTFDEIRRFHGLLPKPESWEWSATPWSTPCVDEDDTWVMGLLTVGNVNDGNCTSTYGSRPAFLIPSQYAVEVDGGLDQYTTNELIAEINRRMNG